MTDLAAFLAARLDEDEAAAREMHEARVCSGCSDGWEAGFDPERCDCGYPARVLREVAAKRAILENYVTFSAYSQESPGIKAAITVLENVIRHLAAVYSDHPDYREW
jgi:hypothetical protein